MVHDAASKPGMVLANHTLARAEPWLWSTCSAKVMVTPSSSGGLLSVAPLLQVQRKHGELCHRMLRVMRSVDGLEGRFAAAVGHHSPETSATEAQLAEKLRKLEASTGAASHGGDSLIPQASSTINMQPIRACT